MLNNLHSEQLLLALVVIAAISDLSSRRIPNSLVLIGLSLAFLFNVVAPPRADWQTWLLGALTGFFIFLPLYLLRGMAAGDVKLMAAVGSFVGPLIAAKIALATFLIGGVMSLVLILAKGRVFQTWHNMRALWPPASTRSANNPAPPYQSAGHLPYALAIALGTLTVMSMLRW